MTSCEQFSEFETVERCTICGEAGSLEKLFEPDVSRCSKCRTILRDHRPTQKQIKASYDTGATYEQWKTEDKPREAMWARRVAQINRLAIAHGVSTSGDLLDIGTGDGNFLQAASRGEWNILSTEFSDDGAARARARGFTVLTGQLSSIDFGDRQFDLITLWHVLEHMPNPGEVLGICHRLLRQGGMLVVAVPNEANVMTKYRLGLRKGPNPFGEIHPGGEIHLTHFEPHSLKCAFRLAHFNIVEFGVDDIYYDRGPRNRLQLAFQGTLAKLTGWHMTRAMFCVGLAQK